ncbi:MAG: redoxin domain-containing protein [Proteobacteria bacterium]|nr:redoxin domain-containing protein [Pseudomonadota bacterium]
MGKSRNSRLSLLLGLLFSAWLVLLPIVQRPVSGQPEIGESFLHYEYSSPARRDDCAYLGVPEGKGFTIQEIEADLIVVMVLNIHCTACQMQAPVYNEVIWRLEGDPLTRGRIKWIGVGVGNNEIEVKYFREEKGISFPILADEDFKFYNVLGGPDRVRVPLTILIGRDEDRGLIIINSHTGFRQNGEEIFRGIKGALPHGKP